MSNREVVELYDNPKTVSRLDTSWSVSQIAYQTDFNRATLLADPLKEFTWIVDSHSTHMADEHAGTQPRVPGR